MAPPAVGPPARTRPDVVAAMTGFLAHLRANGFHLGFAETRAALVLVDRLGAVRQRDCQLGLKILLCGDSENWARFDSLFEAFWFARGKVRTPPRAGSDRDRAAQRPAIWDSHLAAAPDAGGRLGEHQGRDGDADGTASGRLRASRQRSIARTDLRELSDPAEIAAAQQAALRMARALRYRLSRRYRNDRRRRRLDLRRTIRANLSRGGDPVDLIGRARPSRPVEIVVLVDVSGSMQPYTRFFLQFLGGLVGGWPRTDAYLCHTSLVRVTDALRGRDPLKALDRLSLMATGLGGGTRLGGCLRQFNRHHARSTINSRSVVIVMSDGYDTEGPEALATELARLKQRVRRLVWVNPLLGWRDYRPVTAAMAAALPHIDLFAAGHTLDALSAIEPQLARL